MQRYITFTPCMHYETDLKRIQYGKVNLGDLPIGKWRYLTKEELTYCQEQIQCWQDSGPSWDIR